MQCYFNTGKHPVNMEPIDYCIEPSILSPLITLVISVLNELIINLTINKSNPIS